MKKRVVKKDVMKKKARRCNINVNSRHGCSGCSYFLGFIGAVVYYISTASGFWMGVLGFLKALVWPAFLVYEVLKYLAI